MRFELLAPHCLKLDGIDQVVDAGTIIDARRVPNFTPTPAMEPLDDAAKQLLRETLVAMRPAALDDVNIPGYGHFSELLRRAL